MRLRAEQDAAIPWSGRNAAARRGVLCAALLRPDGEPLNGSRLLLCWTLRIRLPPYFLHALPLFPFALFVLRRSVALPTCPSRLYSDAIPAVAFSPCVVFVCLSSPRTRPALWHALGQKLAAQRLLLTLAIWRPHPSAPPCTCSLKPGRGAAMFPLSCHCFPLLRRPCTSFFVVCFFYPPASPPLFVIFFSAPAVPPATRVVRRIAFSSRVGVLHERWQRPDREDRAERGRAERGGAYRRIERDRKRKRCTV